MQEMLAKQVYAACLCEGDEVYYSTTPKLPQPIIQSAIFVGWFDDDCTMLMLANINGGRQSAILNISSVEFYYDAENFDYEEFIQNRLPGVKERYVSFLIKSAKTLDAIVMDEAFEHFHVYKDANMVLAEMSGITKKDGTTPDVFAFLNIWTEGYGKNSLEEAFKVFTGVSFDNWLFEAVHAVKTTIRAAQEHLKRTNEIKE